jgi:hypothetical protein
VDTGIFNGDRYFDVFVEYAKQSPEDILIQISVSNRGPEPATVHVLPTLWFRNSWTFWTGKPKPSVKQVSGQKGYQVIAASHADLGERYLYCEGDVPLLFTENETNNERIFGTANASPYVKDGINNFVVNGNQNAVNPEKTGTKSAAHYQLQVGTGQTATIRLRLSEAAPATIGNPFRDFAEIMQARQHEADEFYKSITPARVSEDEALVMRQALAGMLWSKQYFFFDVDKWLDEHGFDPMKAQRTRHAQQRMVPHGESARYLDARQMGVSVVRRLGPCVPHRRALHGRCGVRQRTARPDAAVVLPPSDRSNPGLRVELQRRQSARTCLGDDLPLPDGAGP